MIGQRLYCVNNANSQSRLNATPVVKELVVACAQGAEWVHCYDEGGVAAFGLEWRQQIVPWKG